jgi:hypothetical protein
VIELQRRLGKTQIELAKEKGLNVLNPESSSHSSNESGGGAIVVTGTNVGNETGAVDQAQGSENGKKDDAPADENVSRFYLPPRYRG